MEDRTVWPKNSIQLAHAVKTKGVPVQRMRYEGDAHVDMIAKLAKPLRGDRHLLQEIIDW